MKTHLLFKLLIKTLLKSFYILLINIIAMQLLISKPINSQTLSDVKISIHLDEVSVEEVFKKIESLTDFNFTYNASIKKQKKVISLKIVDGHLRQVLEQIAANISFNFRRINNTIYVIPRGKKESIEIAEELPDRTIEGKVIDAETGEILIGATIVVKKYTNIGTVTDSKGNFTLSVPDDARSLVFSYIGYESIEVAIGNTSTLTISMKSDVSSLQNVVVIGYGTQEKSDVTGSITSLKEESFNNGIITSPEQLFQGKLPGVRIVNSSGEPGAGIDVFIRGAGSIRSGNLPLFVIDGVPLTNGPTSAGGIDVGFGGSRAQNPLGFLNPADIASIDVLKDASAAAIYGARGSNGVVLITTKKAGSEEGMLSYDTYFGLSHVANKLDVLSANEYSANNPGGVFAGGADTDWQDEIFTTATSHYHNLAFGKVEGNTSYRMSLSYLDQDGIIENSNLERIGGRLNVTNSFFDDDRLKINTNLFVSQTKNTGVPTSDGSGSGGELIINALRANPTFPVMENGDFFAFPSGSNPVALLDIFSDNTTTTRILGNIEAKFRLVDNLHYQINLGIDRSISERNTTISQTNLFDVISNPRGFYAQRNNENSSTLVENLLSYDINADELNLTLLAGHAYQIFNVSGTSFSVADFSTSQIDPVNNPNIGTLINPPTGFAQENELQSFFGRANLDWDGRYLFTASIRADGSTRFGENNKYGYFPSFAAGWRISEESFWGNEFISSLKLRVSWGQTGNQEVPNKVTKASFASSSGAGAFLGTGNELTNGITLARTANPDLKWEVVTQTDIGVDFEFAGGKFYGTIDWFNKVTSDVILLIPATAPSPTSTIWTNIEGEIVNSGLEIAIGGSLIQSDDFKWNADINGTFLRNEVRGLPLSEIITGSLSGPGLSGATVNIITNGESLGSFLLFDHLGFEGGLNNIRDTNGDGLITNEDRVIAGDALPDFIFGFNNYFKLSNWDLSFNLVGEFGASLYNNTANAYFNVPQFFNGNNVPREVISSGEIRENSPAVSTFYLEDADFVRLNNLTLGYSFNTNNISWLGKLRLYATTQNLFVITDYSGFDPGVNTSKAVGGNTSYGIDFASYPASRTFLFGLNVTF